jgi:hypothetical protein
MFQVSDSEPLRPRTGAADPTVISTNRRLTSPAVPEMTLPGSIVRMGPLRA